MRLSKKSGLVADGCFGRIMIDFGKSKKIEMGHFRSFFILKSAIFGLKVMKAEHGIPDF